MGSVKCSVEVDNRLIDHKFFVVDGISPDVILGTDYLTQVEASFEFLESTYKLTVKPHSVTDASVVVNSARVCLKDKTVLPAMHACMVQVTCNASTDDQNTSVYLLQGLTSFTEKHPNLEVGEVILSNYQMSEFSIPVTNIGDSDEILYPGTNVAVAEELTTDTVVIEDTIEESCARRGWKLQVSMADKSSRSM